MGEQRVAEPLAAMARALGVARAIVRSVEAELNEIRLDAYDADEGLAGRAYVAGERALSVRKDIEALTETVREVGGDTP